MDARRKRERDALQAACRAVLERYVAGETVSSEQVADALRELKAQSRRMEEFVARVFTRARGAEEGAVLRRALFSGTGDSYRQACQLAGELRLDRLVEQVVDVAVLTFAARQRRRAQQSGTVQVTGAGQQRVGGRP